MSNCPSCFNELTESMYFWICQSGKCEQAEDDVATTYRGAAVAYGTLQPDPRPVDAKRNWRGTRNLQCRLCSEAMSEACPVCHYILLPGWRDGQASCIAMNGARATGKSLYIAVVVKALEQLALRWNTTLVMDAKTREIYTRVYERPLYVERGLLEPTPRSNTDSSYQRDPLIFSLGMLSGRRRYIVIRDVAGEEMETPPGRATHLQFLAHADCVFFMFDPLAVPSVRDKLVDLVPAQLRSGGDPSVVLNNFLNLVAGHTPRLAVILSKFDALQELRQVDDVTWSSIMSNSGAAFLRDPGEEHTAYDAEDGELLHEEVKSLLFELDARDIVTSLENPQDGRRVPYRFFAVSALGASPDGQQLNARGIAPFRILDPIKWVLSSVGVI
jgi:hypothetical protein